MTPTSTKTKGDLWYVYDGQCPFCGAAARAFRIRKAVGQVHLIDARQQGGHALLKEINARGLDLDRGSVILFGGRFYHGGETLVIMALLSSNAGWFNRMNALVFRSRHVARFCYPILRAGRNLLLRIRGIEPIRNLKTHTPSA